jgi:ABC-2 type transport system ATP-binding protein
VPVVQHSQPILNAPLSFSLNAGRVLGFLGPNGAGKTTAIRILTTILESDSGHFSVDGISSNCPEKIRRKIGVLPESLGFPRQMTGMEYLTFFGQLYGRSATEARTYGLKILQEVGLEQRAKSLIGSYSRGMRQRLGIARALIHDPVVVFLDEPTLSLDPRGQQELLALVRWIAHERNAGVVLCSHLLSEIEDVCDDVVILNSGQVVAQGTVSEVIGQAQGNTTQTNGIRLHVPPLLVAEAQKLLEAMPNVMKAEPIGEMAGWLRVQLVSSVNRSSAEDLSLWGWSVHNRILETLIHAEIPVISFEAEGSRLQDVFFQLTEGVAK